MKVIKTTKNKPMKVQVISDEDGFSYLHKYFLRNYSKKFEVERCAITLDINIKAFRSLIKELSIVCQKTGPLCIKGTIYTDEKNETVFRYCLDSDGIFEATTKVVPKGEFQC